LARSGTGLIANHDLQQRCLCDRSTRAEQAQCGLWLIDPVNKDLRTCAVRDTSTVRYLSSSAGRFRRTFRSLGQGRNSMMVRDVVDEDPDLTG
jgi:hypothetical protein